MVGLGVILCAYIGMSFAADEVKIGASISLSGRLPDEGNGLKEGYELWSDFVNDKDGVDCWREEIEGPP